MYYIIDNLLACANMLCGIEPIKYQGAETDFLTFLMKNPNVTKAFVASVLVGVFIVFIFGIIAIIRSIGSEKVEKTPAQIAVQIGKTLLTFLFVPAAMIILITLTNMLMQILYTATSGGSDDGLGRFLAGAFGQNALKGRSDFYLDPNFDYMDTGDMKEYVHLSDYDFFFSYIASLVIIISLGIALLMFVDRAISIIILFIFSPLSLSTAVLDDGARFKLWRDQFLTKFLTGYGCIIAINIYAIIVVAITNDSLSFFNNSYLNFFMKIVIVVGGGVSLQRMMALVGNLIAAGAGSNEMRDAAIAGGQFRRAVFGGVGSAFGATRGAINFVRDIKNNGVGSTIGRALGFKTSRDYDIERGQVARGRQAKPVGGANQGGAGSANNRAGVADNRGGKSNAVKNAIGGGAQVGGNAVGGAANNAIGAAANNNNQGNNMVNNSINNSLRNNNNNNGNGGNK